MIEVMPERLGIEEMQLFLAVAEQLANPRVVKQQPAVLVDDVQPGRTVFENFAKLAFVLRNIVPGRIVSSNRASVGTHCTLSSITSGSESATLGRNGLHC